MAPTLDSIRQFLFPLLSVCLCLPPCPFCLVCSGLFCFVLFFFFFLQRVKRLGQEHADLSQSLPLSLSSSVFVRTHEDQMDWMQVRVTGDTSPATRLMLLLLSFCC